MKTRIKVIKYEDGSTQYIPQYRRMFVWKDIKDYYKSWLLPANLLRSRSYPLQTQAVEAILNFRDVVRPAKKSISYIDFPYGG